MDNITKWNAVVTISLGQSQSVSVTEVNFTPKLQVCTAPSNMSITLVTIQKHTKFGNSQRQNRTYIIQ